MSRTLAVLGGERAFAELLHVGRPNIGDREYLLSRINEALDRRWLTNHGPLVREFEERVAEISGVKHCVAMANGTIALEIAIRAAGLTGEVIVPSFTFVATAHALQWQQITPVFCDVDPRTHTLDPKRVEELITPRTTGIIGVHTWGRPCDIDALTALAERHGLTLLFDAAHAFACTYRRKGIGGFGLAETFSFHATKFVNCLEGGALVTNDDELARTARLKQNFGFVNLDTVTHVGTNGKMNEFSAAMGLTNLKNLCALVEHNRTLHAAYREHLSGLPGVTFMEYDDAERNNYQYVIVEIDAGEAPLTRDELVQVLFAENIRARRYFYPGCHRMEPYASMFPENDVLLPETERLSNRVLALPTGETLSTADVAKVAGVIRDALAQAEAVRSALRGSASRAVSAPPSA